MDQMRGQTIVEGTATDVEMPIKLIEADVVGVEADAEPQADLVKKNGKRH